MLCGQIFVGVRREVIRPKGVTQTVRFPRHSCDFADLTERPLERNFVSAPQLALGHDAEGFKPRGERRSDFH